MEAGRGDTVLTSTNPTQQVCPHGNLKEGGTAGETEGWKWWGGGGGGRQRGRGEGVGGGGSGGSDDEAAIEVGILSLKCT